MYEVTGQQLTTALTESNPTVFKQETVDLILQLATPSGSDPVVISETIVPTNGQVTVASGTDVALVTLSGSGTTVVTPPANIPVIVFNSATGSVEVEFNDTAPAGNAQRAPELSGSIQRVVVGPGGNDKMIIKDAKNSYVDGGTGNDTVGGGSGNDSVVGGQGNDSVSGGAGNDTIVSGVGNDTVDGGTGFDQASIAGNIGDYVVTVESGHVKMTKSDGTVTELQNVQYVQLEGGKAVITAADKSQAALATLYETLFHRTADAGGLEYWFNTAANGQSVQNIGQTFVDIGGTAFSNLSNDQFVELLYQNTFNRAGDASGKEFWLAQLTSGHSRGEIAATFANIAVDSFDNPEITTVGYVKIIDGTI